MNILVIGNGFDIAHGLSTKYGEFLAYVDGFIKQKRGEKNNFFEHFKNLKNNNPQIYDEIEKMVESNCWLVYFIKIYASRNLEGKNGWIDFESEISNVIQTLDAARKTMQNSLKNGTKFAKMEQWQYNILSQVFTLDENVQSIHKQITPNMINRWKQRLLDDLNRITRCLEIYLCTYLSTAEGKALRDIAELKIDKILSFNYINTYEKIYSKASVPIEYDFIHGKADITNNINSCNLVLGIDEYLPDEYKSEDNEFVEFKKFYQRIFKETSCCYIDWLDSRHEWKGLVPPDPPELNIYIYGHSLDVTDADILRRLILEEGAKTTIFYHDQKAFGKQIANLVKVIGEDELIKRTGGEKRTIIFKQSSKEKVEQQTTNT